MGGGAHERGAAARSWAGPPESAESVSSAAAMSAGEIELASKKDNSFPLDKPVRQQCWQVAASLGAVPDRRASWVIYGATLRRRCSAWCASLVALATLSSLASAGMVQPTLSGLCELLRDVLVCAGGGKMCWSVKRSLIVQVLQLRGLDREEVQGCTDEAVRVFEELIMQVPSCLAEAQKWGLEGLLKAGFPGQPFTYAAWHTDTHCLPCAPSHPHGVRCLTGRYSHASGNLCIDPGGVRLVTSWCAGCCTPAFPSVQPGTLTRAGKDNQTAAVGHGRMEEPHGAGR